MTTQKRTRPSLSMPLLRVARFYRAAGDLTLGKLLASLGETSFGWAIIVFSLLTMLPMPPGSSVVTALPVMLVTLQMLLGFDHVRLPLPLARLRVDPMKLRRTVLRLRPVTRRLERVVRPRSAVILSRRGERLLSGLSLSIALALFLPVPFSGWFPAISLLIVGVGLVERDGLVTLLGLTLGLASVALTASIALSLAAGAESFLY